MTDVNINSILAEYDSAYTQNEAFEIKMRNLISDLLQSEKLKVHNISSRLKERNSLEKKISVKNKYTNLNEITDMVGVRIITFFEDEVDIVADLIKKEFDVDDKNSIDKRVVEYDKFGYSSLHFVVSLNRQRNKLLEYKSYKNLKFEIQIRSILQHAWAEIEHDIGYKSKNSIPDVVKRNFSRVAALLETSDLEFSKLRIKLLEYENEVDLAISTNPMSVELNDISLESFLQNSKVALEIERKISSETKIKLEENNFDTGDIPKLQELGINNIENLSTILNAKKDIISKFAVQFLNDYRKLSDGWMERGISLFYLCYILLLETNDTEKLKIFIEKYFKLTDTSELYKQILKSYEVIKQE